MKRNKIIGLLLSGVMMFGVVGCSDIKKSDLTSTEVNVQTESRKSTNKFNKYNILTFNEIEVDKKPKYEGDTWINFKCKVINNSDKIINTISVDFGFYDEEGTLVKTIQPQELNSIEERKSFYVNDIYNMEEIQPKEIKIIGYSYYIDDHYYTVDLISKDAEIWNVIE